MGRSNRGDLAAELMRARDRFESWRTTRKPKSRIPEPLWDLAVELVGRHGLHRTASALKLDYYSLKKRVEANAALAELGIPTFIELDSAVGVGRQCTLEFAARAGVVMRIQLAGYGAAEIIAVGRSLRDAQ